MNPDKFLDKTRIQKNDVVMTTVNQKDRNKPVHGTFRIPKWYKSNSLISKLNRSLHISSYLTDEIAKIRQKFLNGDYPL